MQDVFFYGLAARALNDTIMLVHDNKLTRKQYVMFALADMITYVEVGAVFARKASALTEAGRPEAEKIKAMSRIFSNDVAQLVAEKILIILMGSGIFDKQATSHFLETVAYNELISSCHNIINDMDTVADILFSR